MNETWKDIEGYEGIYEVSSLGRVRSYDRVLKDLHTRKPYVKKGQIEHLSQRRDGYLQITLYHDGKGKTKGVSAGGRSLHPEPSEPATSEPQRREQAEQPRGESGMVYGSV